MLNRVSTSKALVLSFIILLMALPALCADTYPREVVVTGPSWQNFTNEDGTGLYHELLHAAYAPLGMEVKRVYAPSERAYEMVREGRADFMTCNDLPVPQLVPATRPMYENNFHAFFKKTNVPNWKGAKSLVGRQVVWRKGYYSPENFPEGIRYRELVSGASCLGVVILGRADFYIDDISLIRMSLEKNKMPFNMDEFDIRPVGKRTYYPMFADTPEGRESMKTYEKAMDALYKSGKMKKIFDKWDFEVPAFYTDRL